MPPSVGDPSTWNDWGTIDPELERILASDAAPAFAKSTDIDAVVSTRALWAPKYKAVADRALEATGGKVTSKEIAIPLRDGNNARALVYQPSDFSEDVLRPLVVLIHGGGFCFGTPEMEGGNCSRVVEAYGCVAISLSYRLAPEHKFPTATDDCWDELKWVVQNASKLGADLSEGFVLGGTSAGGNISIVLSHMARDEKLPPLTGVYMNVPLVMAPEAVPEKYKQYYQSREQNALAPILNKAFMDMYTTAYAPSDKGSFLSSYIWSPINWPGGDKAHVGMPRTYFQICGLDVLRDEGLIYERVLREEYGVSTKVDIYPGLPHILANMVQNKALVFTEVPKGLPVAGQHLQIQNQDDFDVNMAAPVGGFTGQVLYASLDPYLRNRMVTADKERDGFQHIPLNSVISNGLIARVIRADAASGLQSGNVVVGMAPIQEYIAVPQALAAQFQKIQNPYGLDFKHFLGALGMPGMTAYSAFHEVGKPKKGETIFISAASGAVGQLVGQLAKLEGLTVLGSVGSDEKLKLLTDVLGFDGGFNYRTSDPLTELKRLAPGGIDIYFDNVAGEQLDAALMALRDRGRIVACGYASQYSLPPDQQYGIRNTSQVIAKQLTWQGLSVFDPSMGAAYAPKLHIDVGKWLAEGSFHTVMCETKGIDNAPAGLVQLLRGENVGKAYVNFGAPV
ncbi:hypothetical protein SCUCBS95973_003019 [Sporothrix curviconia]|uniref:Enoyl reductase (ER) domain-containing protein n=1 Tax=Sporothrix curviconia TaxID=1260050 RepID=A0ABP0BBT7_9PEZI